MSTRNALLALAAVLGLALAGCNYDAPLTAEPTQPIDHRLLGNWETKDGDKVSTLVVRELDATHYVLTDDGDLYRAFHSDLAGRPFVSVQNLQPDHGDRKYAYITWRLAADGQLVLRAVNTKVIPEQATDTAGMQKLVRQKLDDPELLGEELVYHRPVGAKP